MFTTPWKSPQRVALFGTSADPPHLGHQSILLWLAQEFDQVAVWAADNPYKAKQSPIGDRVQMLRLLIETLLEQGTGPLGEVSVRQDFSDRYSINSITRARKRWPKARFYFVVGADLLTQLPKWYQAKEIFAQVDILVFPRPGYPIQGPALSALRQLATVHIAKPPYQHDVSSSTFRNTRCAEQANAKNANDKDANDKDANVGISKITENIPAVIRDYITEHDLYPCQQSTHPSISRAKVSTLR